jgi:hypothetical protein
MGVSGRMGKMGEMGRMGRMFSKKIEALLCLWGWRVRRI